MKWARITRAGDDGKPRASLFASLDGETFVDAKDGTTKEQEVRVALARSSTLRYSRDLLTKHGAEFSE